MCDQGCGEDFVGVEKIGVTRVSLQSTEGMCQGCTQNQNVCVSRCVVRSCSVVPSRVLWDQGCSQNPEK